MRAARRSARVAIGWVLLLGLCAGLANAADKKEASASVLPETHAVVVHDGVASTARSDGLVTLAVGRSGSDAPRRLGWLRLKGSPVHVVVEGQRAFVSTGTRGLAIVDLTDPSAPASLATIPVDGKIRAAGVLGDLAYLADQRHGLQVVDLGEPDRPFPLARIRTREEMLHLALKPPWLATAEGRAGARLFDIGDPRSPDEKGRLDGSEGARHVAFDGPYLLVAAGRAGLLVYLIADLPAGGPVARIPPVRSAEFVSAEGGLAVVSNGSSGVQLIDLGAEGGPAELSSVTLGRFPATGAAFRVGERVYVPAGRGGIAVVGIEDRNQPALLHPREKKLEVRFPR